MLVHGAGGDHMHWPGQLRRLPGVTVYSLDLPGHGKSVGHGRASIGDYAEVVIGFANALTLPRFALAGHSMGGAITQEVALRWPERLAGVILVGSGARLRVAPQILEGILRDYPGTTELLTRWAHGGSDEHLLAEYCRRLQQVPAQVIHADYLACDGFDGRPDVAHVALPALIICGLADRMTPPKYSQWLHDQLADSELVWVSEAGHMVMLERPVEVAAAVAGFMAKLAAADEHPPPRRGRGPA